MRKLIVFFLAVGITYSLLGQTVTISATTNCFNPAVTVPFVFNYNGRPAYDTPSGNLGGISPAQVTVLWETASTRWEIKVGGGTIIYINTTNSPNPPSTGWQAFGASFPLGTCGAGDPAPTLSGDVTLPVELISFRGTQSDRAINLTWTTASETNNEGFEIQKSKDGITWEKIFFEKGKGTSNQINEYKYTDDRPFLGLNYFRLKQIDFDEKSEYSHIEVVTFESKNQNLIISPNPFYNVVKIELTTFFLIDTEIILHDFFGKEVGSFVFEKNNLSQKFDFSHLKKGVYFFQIKVGQENSLQKIVKF